MVAALTCRTLALIYRVQIEMAVPLHGIDQHRDQRLQALAADPIGRLPQHRQRLAHRLVIETIAGARTVLPCWTSSRSTRIACLR